MEYVGLFINRNTPNSWMVFSMDNPIFEWMILELHPMTEETSMWIFICVYIWGLIYIYIAVEATNVGTTEGLQ